MHTRCSLPEDVYTDSPEENPASVSLTGEVSFPLLPHSLSDVDSSVPGLAASFLTHPGYNACGCFFISFTALTDWVTALVPLHLILSKPQIPDIKNIFFFWRLLGAPITELGKLGLPTKSGVQARSMTFGPLGQDRSRPGIGNLGAVALFPASISSPEKW